MQNNKSNIKERLALFLEYLGIGQAKFAKNVGLSRGYINNLGKSIQTDTLEKIRAIYPELNIEWLLYGKGDMLRPNEAEIPTDFFALPQEAWQIIKEQTASLKAKDEQMSRIIASLESRDRQIDEMISVIREQIKNGQLADNLSRVVAAVGE